MELQWFFRAMVRRWYLVLIPVLGVGAYVAYDYLNQPAGTVGYRTVVRFTAAQPENAEQPGGSVYENLWLPSEYTVRLLTDWIPTSSFRRAVAERAAEQGIEFPPDALPTRADHDRSVGQLFIDYWRDADELATITEIALDVLNEENGVLPPFADGPAQVTVLDDVNIAPVAPPIVDTAEPLVRLALAVIAGVGLAALAEYLDPTLRTRDEVERTGIDVIASLPRE
jgi:hypothetical protein